ncbi:DUF2145 domain-containing protein [Cellvibrio japonicus]|uniref:DUF2145 domain-containing protein n=1 Tax=Cellvibrio japonicus (strain Ueda107) TaxID=498211 RepID=B3PLA7_CELJU|nr:DUF2145 domain-containing protein [Cellvibrio japonicus]ACE85157.1 conserved hypothetical protein [Cellvibrio japonicus Ueda107]QEI11564.1 DUF2145 domain-containing protein [Cellvibrio japonicus]QEI15138.1 DUF2145 domain-containing protein [Cellvibrio japonicus]QEI18718.1 DUF2145 domain-containing protein [Cellvibrio japonicus]
MKNLLPLIGLLCLLSNPSVAGSTAKTSPQFATEEITLFAKSVEKYAAAKGARAFIIGRMGRPAEELPEGIEFTHTAVAIYSSITLSSGDVVKGYAIHNLYQQEQQIDRSELVTDYPVDFFWSAYALRAGIIIPSPGLQQRLINAYANGVHQQVHRPAYSVIANPFNEEYQNCTEHTLDVINAAIYDTTDYAQLKANTQAHFKAQRIHISGVKLALGSALMKDVTTRDHKGKVLTATFGSIGAYLAQNHLLREAIILEQDGSQNPLRDVQPWLAQR